MACPYRAALALIAQRVGVTQLIDQNIIVLHVLFDGGICAHRERPGAALIEPPAMGFNRGI